MKINKQKVSIVLLVVLILSLFGCSDNFDKVDNDTNDNKYSDIESVDEKEFYYSLEDVSLYIHTYGKLPRNFLTKNEARDLGWIQSEGNLWDVTDKGVIGGDKFGNREGLLPKKEGRQYFECDIDYKGGKRGAKRIVYSNDGLIFFTNDHYATFEEITFN